MKLIDISIVGASGKKQASGRAYTLVLESWNVGP